MTKFSQADNDRIASLIFWSQMFERKRKKLFDAPHDSPLWLDGEIKLTVAAERVCRHALKAGLDLSSVCPVELEIVEGYLGHPYTAPALISERGAA